MAGKTSHTLPLTFEWVRNLHILGNMPWSRVIQARDSTPPSGILSATLQAALRPDQVQQLYSPCFFFLIVHFTVEGVQFVKAWHIIGDGLSSTHHHIPWKARLLMIWLWHRQCLKNPQLPFFLPHPTSIKKYVD